MSEIANQIESYLNQTYLGEAETSDLAQALCKVAQASLFSSSVNDESQMIEINNRVLSWLKDTYSEAQRADERQASMGLQYMKFDSKELANSFANFIINYISKECDVFYSEIMQRNDPHIEGGFWSNEHGWGQLEDATLFFKNEDIEPPRTSGNDCQRISLLEAYASVEERIIKAMEEQGLPKPR